MNVCVCVRACACLCVCVCVCEHHCAAYQSLCWLHCFATLSWQISFKYYPLFLSHAHTSIEPWKRQNTHTLEVNTACRGVSELVSICSQPAFLLLSLLPFLCSLHPAPSSLALFSSEAKILGLFGLCRWKLDIHFKIFLWFDLVPEAWRMYKLKMVRKHHYCISLPLSDILLVSFRLSFWCNPTFPAKKISSFTFFYAKRLHVF